MDPVTQFKLERAEVVAGYAYDAGFRALSSSWLQESVRGRYVYNFDWLGRPIIQYPQDIVAIQELIWMSRPDVIVETGIAHGGSIVLSASMLALLDLCDAVETGNAVDPRKPFRRVIGVDIDIRSHNRTALENHPMAPRISMVQGSSIDMAVVEQVREIVGDARRVMVCLDSNHTHDHVLAELNSYAAMVTLGCYCIVFDTFVEDMPANTFPARPWGPSNNPKTAVREYLKYHPEFRVDTTIQDKLLITAAPEGYLKRVE